MFADSKNPLAADLIKEFKAISKDKTIKPSQSPKPAITQKPLEASESTSTVLLSRLRSKDNTKGKDETWSTSDKPDIFKRYSVNMIDLTPDRANNNLSPLSIPTKSKVPNQRASKKLDKILALKAKSKPVPLPVSSTLKEQRTKSVQNFLVDENPEGPGELVFQRSVSLDSWDSDEDELEKDEGRYGSFYEEPNTPGSLVSGSISPTSIVSQRGYYPVPFQFERGNSDSGKTKPPIPTPRPNDTKHKSYKEDNVDHRSQSPAPNINQEGTRNPGLGENIYESLDFRESIDIDSEDDHLPDILKHTKSTKSRTKSSSEEIYENLEPYQAEEDYDGYLSLASLEPPTPSRLNPQFTFPRRGIGDAKPSRGSILPPKHEFDNPTKDSNLTKSYNWEKNDLHPSSSSPAHTILSIHLGKVNVSKRRESLGALFTGNVNTKGHPTSSLPSRTSRIVEEDNDVTKSIERFPWFRDISRKRAEQLIKEVGCDGTFLLRRSKNGGVSSPYTLTLLYQQNMFHINVRAFSNGKFALGKSKVNEMMFDSVEEIVKRHRYEPLMLVGLDGKSAGSTILSRFPWQ